MRKKKIKAVFKGENGSMGLLHGREYDLNIYPGPKAEINITFGPADMLCVYSNILTFLDNWDSIHEIYSKN